MTLFVGTGPAQVTVPSLVGHPGVRRRPVRDAGCSSAAPPSRTRPIRARSAVLLQPGPGESVAATPGGDRGRPRAADDRGAGYGRSPEEARSTLQGAGFSLVPSARSTAAGRPVRWSAPTWPPGTRCPGPHDHHPGEPGQPGRRSRTSPASGSRTRVKHAARGRPVVPDPDHRRVGPLAERRGAETRTRRAAFGRRTASRSS
ncbi:hypothetical protein HBB16_04865 [Pseudonocardia sp. MCCB 268]|nr:hypothetical protein [Pseudonocardia cytotoxica]